MRSDHRELVAEYFRFCSNKKKTIVTLPGLNLTKAVDITSRQHRASVVIVMRIILEGRTYVSLMLTNVGRCWALIGLIRRANQSFTLLLENKLLIIWSDSLFDAGNGKDTRNQIFVKNEQHIPSQCLKKPLNRQFSHYT